MDETDILTYDGAQFYEKLPNEVKEVASVKEGKRDIYSIQFAIGVDTGQKEYLRESIINECITQGKGEVRLTDQKIEVRFMK